MLHESLFAPFAQWNMFRSPDVAGLPCVTGSMHAVMTPLWTPGNGAMLAPATPATTANKTTTPTASSFVDGDFIYRTPSLVSSRGRSVRSSACFSKAPGGPPGRTLDHDQRLRRTRRDASVGATLPAAASPPVDGIIPRSRARGHSSSVYGVSTPGGTRRSQGRPRDGKRMALSREARTDVAARTRLPVVRTGDVLVNLWSTSGLPCPVLGWC